MGPFEQGPRIPLSKLVVDIHFDAAPMRVIVVKVNCKRITHEAVWSVTDSDDLQAHANQSGHLE